MKHPTFATVDEACRFCGVEPKDLRGSGFIAANVAGARRGRGSGRIRFYPDGQGGFVQNWTDGRKACFFYGYGGANRLPREDWLRLKAERDRRRAEENALFKATQAAVAGLAGLILEAAHPSANPHPYLLKKHVADVLGAPMIEIEREELCRVMQANEVPQLDGVPQRFGRLNGRVLVLQLTLDVPAPVSLQLIDASGSKTFLKGGRKQGAVWRPADIPVVSDEMTQIGIAEGVATALSVRHMFGVPCLAGIDCGNLVHAVHTVRTCYPKAQILLFADRDASGAGEAGARAAACAVNRTELYVCPEFSAADRLQFKKLTGGDKPSDFNDLMIIREGY